MHRKRDWMRKKDGLVLSGAAFARLAGVSRAGVSQAANKGLLEKTESGKLSLDNPVNQTYLQNHNANIEDYMKQLAEPPGDDIPTQESLFESRSVPISQTMPEHGAPKTEQKKNGNNGHSDTNGNDHGKGYLEKLVLEERHRKLLLENEQMLGHLIEQKLVRSMIEEIGHGIQTSLVDLPRREAPVLAAIVGAPEKERDIEMYLSEKIQQSITAIQGNIERLAGDGTFE